MIKLTKRPKPQILIDNESKWTKDLMQHYNEGTKPPDSLKHKYRHDDIKKEVILETNGKCVYCESFVIHQYPGDIEHIIPKSIQPNLTFSWDNLSFACYLCNNNKRDEFDETCKLLNPYTDEIVEHLRAYGPMILHINNSKRGELTHKKIKLNRMALVEKRTEAIKNVQNLIDKYKNVPTGSLKNVLKQEIIECANSDKEYSFFINQFLSDCGIV